MPGTVCTGLLLPMLFGLCGFACYDEHGLKLPPSPPPPRQRRNVVLLIGDGMPLVSEVATSRYLRGTDFALSFHSFPAITYVTTWDVTVYNAHAAKFGLSSYDVQRADPKVGYDPAVGGSAPFPLHEDTDASREYFVGEDAAYPDSAATATAMSTGLKTVSHAISWGPPDSGRGALETIAERVRATNGMAVGFATTVPFSHATPAGFFAHNPSRDDTQAIAR